MTSLENKFKKIISSWFLNEPLLFAAESTHSLIQNQNLSVPMRTGKNRIEYSPKILSDFSFEQIEFYLKTEIYRILLKHPYERLPQSPNYEILAIASDVCIYQTFYCKKTPFGFVSNEDCELSGILYLKSQAARFKNLKYPLGKKWENTEELKFFQRNLQLDYHTGNLKITDDLSFEQWYKKILFLVKETSILGENAGFSQDSESILNLKENSELWEENEDSQNEIENQIKNAENNFLWGEVGENAQRKLKEGADFSFDYRKALTQFRCSIINSSRILTRMKPSRRYGFQAMGSRYVRKANILIAVDVSGSISDDSFDHFTHAIKNFFFLGIIEKIDLIFFDVNLKNTKPISFRKKIDLNQINGRGGTNFQVPIDFFCENKNNYSGLIIFTDGKGAVPIVNGSKNNILWILDSRIAWEESKNWIKTLNGCKSTYLPF